MTTDALGVPEQPVFVMAGFGQRTLEGNGFNLYHHAAWDLRGRPPEPAIRP